MLDTFNGVDPLCVRCSDGEGSNQHRDFNHPNNHQFEPARHNISVTWVTRWEITCLCGWKCVKGSDSKLTAEIVAWIHLRRYAKDVAAEFAANRDIQHYVYR